MKLMLTILAAMVLFLAVPAFGATHCYCKLGPVNAPIHDFGSVASWSTRFGRQGPCRDACNMRTDAFMRDANNRAAACARMNGAAVVSYYAVGTDSYSAGGTYTCPQSGTQPAKGTIVFNGTAGARRITVDGTDFGFEGGPIFGVNVSPNKSFVTIRVEDALTAHLQRWTYWAQLYRDGVLVEEIQGRSPAPYSGGVTVEFTQQANAFMRGHEWKIVRQYAGPRFSGGATTFRINP